MISHYLDDEFSLVLGQSFLLLADALQLVAEAITVLPHRHEFLSQSLLLARDLWTKIGQG